MAYKYCIVQNWGEGFIEYSDSSVISFAEFPGNVWQVPANNKDANLWILKVAAQVVTLEQAQAAVDTVITPLQTAWDALSDEEKTADNPRPVSITLPA